MTTTDLQVTVRHRDDSAVVDLRGDVDAAADSTLRAAYADAAQAGAGTVILNFSEAGYINSTGIAVIVGLLAEARTQRVQITAYGLSDHYREIFEITRLADFMTITNDEHSAVSGAKGGDDERISDNA